jgi:hypothetical protein
MLYLWTGIANALLAKLNLKLFYWFYNKKIED